MGEAVGKEGKESRKWATMRQSISFLNKAKGKNSRGRQNYTPGRPDLDSENSKKLYN